MPGLHRDLSGRLHHLQRAPIACMYLQYAIVETIFTLTPVHEKLLLACLWTRKHEVALHSIPADPRISTWCSLHATTRENTSTSYVKQVRHIVLPCH